MSLLVGGWVGCSSTGDQGGNPQSCKGSPGEEFCSCNSSGSCKAGLTCAVDLQMCVHLANIMTASGGGNGTGGSTGGGNSSGTGGTGAGGTSASGGAAGNRSTGTGGVLSTGGTGAVAGSRGNGGSASGGTTGGGGRVGSSGGSTGAAGTTGAGGSNATGGAMSTSCGTLKPSASGNGEFTHYNFGQGTGKQGNFYLTACGYLGTESGSTDTVMNIANTAPAKNTYFAAIPGNSSGNFNSSGSCGTCVQITNSGHTIIATIIDECPEDSNPICKQNPTGELDLSVDAFNALGFANGNPSGTSWKAVPCPVTGNVVVRIKQGNQNEAFIENSILALASVSGPGGNASRTSYGAWHFNSNLGSGSQLTLTDAANRMIQVTLNSGSMNQDQDSGKQFPACDQ